MCAGFCVDMFSTHLAKYQGVGLLDFYLTLFHHHYRAPGVWQEPVPTLYSFRLICRDNPENDVAMPSLQMSVLRLKEAEKLALGMYL